METKKCKRNSLGHIALGYFFYFLQLSEMSKEMSAKVTPTRQTPSQEACVHAIPAKNVPNEPPIK